MDMITLYHHIGFFCTTTQLYNSLTMTYFKRILAISCLLSIFITLNAQSSFKTLDFLNSIRGEKLLAGQHNDQKPFHSTPTGANYWTEEVYTITGKYPALYGCDLLFHGDRDMRWAITYECESQWSKGAVINMMWHACPPTQSEPCNWDGGIKSSLTTAQWNDLLMDGSSLNQIWRNRIDNIAAPYLKYLKDKEVEVLWRPFHEQNQTVFWWNSGGADKTVALWQLTHDYMTKELGLTNLIWSWDVQDIDANYAQYNPGAEYFDLAALDVYGNGFYDLSFYNALVTQANGKPVAFGECFYLPSENVINNQPEMTFFMNWAYGLYEDYNGNPTNTLQQIIDVYENPKVITLDEMPGWDNVSQSDAKVIVDFDGTPYTQGDWNGTAEVVDNPNKTGINTSANVCRYTLPSNKPWQNCAWVIFEEAITYSELDKLELMLIAPSSGEMMVKLENEDLSNEVQPSVKLTPVASSDWQKVTLEFPTPVEGVDENATFDKLAFFFNVNSSIGGEVWYYDNVTAYIKSPDAPIATSIKGTDILSQENNNADEAESNIQLYPNPVIDELTIDVKKGSIEYWQLYDSTGRLMKTNTMNGFSNQEKISMKDLSHGLFFIHIKLAEQEVFVRKKVISFN